MGGTLAPTSPPDSVGGHIDWVAFVQVGSRSHLRAEPIMKEESGGVIAMMDMLKADLAKEITEAKVEEKDSQEEYEAMMKAAAEKRSIDSKTIVEKEGGKAAATESVNVVTKEIKG